MPFGIHKHSNRSKQALNDSVQGTDSEGSSDFIDEARSTQPQVYQQTQQPYIAPNPQSNSSFDQQAQEKLVDSPARSQSTRHSGVYQPAIQAQAGGSAVDLVESRKQQYQPRQQYSQPPPPADAKKSKGFFDRIRTGSTRIPEPRLPQVSPGSPNQDSYNNKEGLARRASKKDHPPLPRNASQRDPQDIQRAERQSLQGSRNLPIQQEGGEDDGGLDPYFVRPSDQGSTQQPPEGHQQTIRPVQSDSEPLAYPSQAVEQHHQYEAQQQHLREQPQHQRGESQNYYQQQNPAQLQPTVNIPPSSPIAGDQYRHQNPETISQLSYEPALIEREEQQRPVSGQSNGQSPNTYNPQQQEYPGRTTSIPLGPRPLSQYTGPPMPPPAATAANRRPADTKQTLPGIPGQGQPEQRDGPPPPNYGRGQFTGGNQPPTPGLSPLPPPPPGAAQGPNYRGGPTQREQFSNTGLAGEQGRSTPPPPTGDRQTEDQYKELLQKYKKVKNLYFEKTSQVEQLQNTLANQRLSQSRTSLDDSEYMARFQRLEGAITNLAYNIRKDWRIVPVWLSQSCNQDAIKIGKQEMTAVGRSCITKLVMDEIFNHTFHPGLDEILGYNLKEIENNIRRNSPPLNNQEEADALTAKVVQWKLATLEGLKEILNSPESEQRKKDFAQNVTSHMAAGLINFLQEPPPAGIEESCHMIVELAVSIASNLPLESRDIAISYPMPGDMLQPNFMRIENPIPALENPGADTGSDIDASSTISTGKDEKDEKDGKSRKEKTMPGMLQGLMGASGGNKLQKSNTEISSEGGKKISTEDGAQKVRFAGFVSVEVRGRQVLVKAPVWTVG